LNYGRRKIKGEEAVELQASQSLKPGFSLRKLRSKLESNQAASFHASNTGQKFWGSLMLNCEVINSGDGRHVTTIFTFKESLNKSLVNVSKKVLDKLILHH
jgi:hypothetical protein